MTTRDYLADPTTLILTISVLLIAFILKDWWSVRFKGNKNIIESCSEDSSCVKRIKGLEARMEKLEGVSNEQGNELTSLSSVFKERTESIMRELQAGHERFNEQFKSIAEIQKSLARLEALIVKKEGEI